MGRIIRFSADRHGELRDLLPWYVTDQLSASDRQRVEAHLAVCEDCRSELHLERRLEEEVARMPIDVDQSWSRMRDRINADQSERPMVRAGGAVNRLAAWSGWAAAAAAVLVLSGAAFLHPPAPSASAPYQMLSSRTATVGAGNVAVIFRPDTPERKIRDALIASGARLVDGPTATGGYVLRISPAGRDAALKKLRSSAGVEMAEAIDSGGSR